MLPKVVILATGGTIVSSGASPSQMTGYSLAELRAQDIIDAVADIETRARIETQTVCNIPSSSITFKIWRDLALAVEKHAARDDVSGVVIMHGTDTMEETAFILNLVLKTQKSVVITGAMRPATALSADGPINLLNAVTLAASGKTDSLGVVIAMNGTILAARDAAKTNTVAVETFAGKITGCMGTIIDTDIDILSASVRPHTITSEFSIADLPDSGEVPRVDILTGYPDGDDAVLQAVIETNPAGIVLAAPGHGTLSQKIERLAYEAVDRGIVVCRTSRTGSGPVLAGLAPWQEHGILYSRTLSAPKARLLFTLGLLKYGPNRQELARLLQTY